MRYWPRLKTRARYGWLNQAQLRKPLASRIITLSGTRGRPRGGGLMPAMVPAQVRASPTVTRPSGVIWLRSSWRVGRCWQRASSIVTRPSLARSFARCGPTPGRASSRVRGPGAAVGTADRSPAVGFVGVKSLLRPQDQPRPQCHEAALAGQPDLDPGQDRRGGGRPAPPRLHPLPQGRQGRQGRLASAKKPGEGRSHPPPASCCCSVVSAGGRPPPPTGPRTLLLLLLGRLLLLRHVEVTPFPLRSSGSPAAYFRRPFFVAFLRFVALFFFAFFIEGSPPLGRPRSPWLHGGDGPPVHGRVARSGRDLHTAAAG